MLPEHLAVLTSRAAISDTWPDVHCSSDIDWAACLLPEEIPPAQRQQAVLIAHMSPLPRHLNYASVDTPAAADHRALALLLPQLRQAEPIIRAMAAAPGAQLTSLALVDCAWDGAVDTAPHTGPSHALVECNADRTAVRRIALIPLATLTQLAPLQIEFAGNGVSGRGGDVENFSAGFGDEVRRLTSLRVRVCSHTGAAVKQLALLLP